MNFWQFLVIIGKILGKIEFFPELIGLFLGGRFFVRTVASDCLADKFGGRLEIATIRLGGWLCGSNRRPLHGRHRKYRREGREGIDNTPGKAGKAQIYSREGREGTDNTAGKAVKAGNAQIIHQ